MDERQLTAERAQGDDGVILGERRLVLGLLGGIVALNVANALVLAGGLDRPGARWLLLALERNPSTWFSAAQLALGAGLAWVVGRERADAARWNLVAVLLLMLSVDEVATLHEKLGGLPLPGVGSRGWAGAGVALVLLTAWRLVPWSLRLERHLRYALLVGGGVFVLGAVGFEVLAGSWQDAHGADGTFWVISSIEEDLELLGVFVVVRVLVGHLRAGGARLSLAVGR